MITEKLEALAEAWIFAKAQESKATESRREIEDKLSAFLDLAPNAEGVSEFALGRYDCHIGHRVVRKVDHEMVGVISAEHGLEALLPVVFRWQASVNAKAWRDLAPEIKRLLAQAITATPNRAGFKITERDEK